MHFFEIKSPKNYREPAKEFSGNLMIDSVIGFSFDFRWSGLYLYFINFLRVF